MELRNENINHARNILDRAVQLLPRVDFLWYKYVWMEEMAQDIPKCRAVFDRWMEWQPDEAAWWSYAKFEKRQGGLTRAAAVLQRYCQVYPTPRAYLKFAKFHEFDVKDIGLARAVYEAALQAEIADEQFLQQFAKFEERQHEYDRARAIYQYAIRLAEEEQQENGGNDENDDGMGTDKEKNALEQLKQTYLTFEKKHGDTSQMESLLLEQRRKDYEERLRKDPFDYDGWLELAKMSNDTPATVRDIYERAVANVPPTTASTTKDDWKRYIYLWINYAVFEELDCHNLERAVQVYETCLKLVPHAQFTFGKIWILLSQLHLRRRDLASARKLLGLALGKVPHQAKLYEHYIDLELSLGEVDRCRTLYENFIKNIPGRASSWIQFATFEQTVGESDRCRAIFELAVQQDVLERPEDVWKAYIAFEVSEAEYDRARKLYERLLELADQHVRVWISYAQFEANQANSIETARAVLQRAYDHFKAEKANEERVVLLDAWCVLEKEKGSIESLQSVEAKLPRRIKRKRTIGGGGGWEEYFDYQFVDDENAAAASNFKILEMAAKWKQEQAGGANDDDDDDDSDDDDSDSEN
jgi:crooked neck